MARLGPPWGVSRVGLSARLGAGVRLLQRDAALVLGKPPVKSLQ